MIAQELRLVLYDYDAMDRDDEIGEAKVAVKDLKDQQEADLWLDIHECTPEANAQNHKASRFLLPLPHCSLSNEVC